MHSVTEQFVGRMSDMLHCWVLDFYALSYVLIPISGTVRRPFVVMIAIVKVSILIVKVIIIQYEHGHSEGAILSCPHNSEREDGLREQRELLR